MLHHSTPHCTDRYYMDLIYARISCCRNILFYGEIFLCGFSYEEVEGKNLPKRYHSTSLRFADDSTDTTTLYKCDIPMHYTTLQHQGLVAVMYLYYTKSYIGTTLQSFFNV